MNNDVKLLTNKGTVWVFEDPGLRSTEFTLCFIWWYVSVQAINYRLRTLFYVS